MTHDTDRMRRETDRPSLPEETTRPAVGPAPVDAVTDPGAPPSFEGATDRDRPALTYSADVVDPEVAALLGALAPARVPPAVGDTRETNGHVAAAFRVPLHAPPRAFDTPPTAPPVVIDDPSGPARPVVVTEPMASAPILPRGADSPAAMSQQGVLNPLGVVMPVARVIHGTTVPRALPRAPVTPKLVAGLAAGVLLMTVVVIVWSGASSSPEPPRSVASATPFAALPASGAAPGAVEPSRTPETPSAAPPIGPASASTPVALVSPRVGATGATPRAGAAASTRPVMPAVPAPSASAPVKPNKLPDDIKWSVE